MPLGRDPTRIQSYLHGVGQRVDPAKHRGAAFDPELDLLGEPSGQNTTGQGSLSAEPG
jgi:hypothetical protein